MRFGDWEILERTEIAGDGFDVRTGEFRIWVGTPSPPGGPDPRDALETLKQKLVRVYHPAVPRVLAAAVVEGRPVLKIQAYSGTRLADLLAEGPLETLRALDLVRGVGAALTKAHAAGVVHGALDEGEILVAEGGRPLLLHLGFGAFLGPRPSRVPGGPVGEGEPTAFDDAAAADVFGLSRVLVRCLTGEDPFATIDPGLSGADLARAFEEAARRSAERLDPVLPEGLRRFTARAVHSDPKARIRRAEELAGDLAVIRSSFDTRESAAARAIPAPRLPRPGALVALVVAAVFAIALGLRSCSS